MATAISLVLVFRNSINTAPLGSSVFAEQVTCYSYLLKAIPSRRKNCSVPNEWSTRILFLLQEVQHKVLRYFRLKPKVNSLREVYGVSFLTWCD